MWYQKKKKKKKIAWRSSCWVYLMQVRKSDKSQDFGKFLWKRSAIEPQELLLRNCCLKKQLWSLHSYQFAILN